jgi:hypothetical protein
MNEEFTFFLSDKIINKLYFLFYLFFFIGQMKHVLFRSIRSIQSINIDNSLKEKK